MRRRLQFLSLLAVCLPPASAKIAANTYLAYTPAAPVYGDTVTIGVLVMSTAGAGIPTGTATLYIDSIKVDVALDSAGHGSFTLPSGSQPPFGAGSHHISTTYNGDANFQAGLPAVLTVPVAKAGSMVTIGLVPTQLDQPTTLRAVVSLGNWSTAPVGGTVDFSNNGSPIPGCTGVPVSGGASSCNPTFPQAGTE